MRSETVGDSRPVRPESAEFPAQLRAIPEPPPVLYVRGALLPEDALAVAVVGARHATPYGIEVAERLSADLASRGVTIVSGLARGIDSAAHQGALRGGGRTIAVLGSGVDVIYPPEHRRLAERIERSGALVSQFPPGAPPLPQHFPMRNRVIAGLALGVVVVEAAERSGSLITAGFGGDLGREVMAVPGRVTSPLSRGAHRLIRDGAVLVEGWEDVVSQLPEQWRRCVAAAPRPPAPGAPSPEPARASARGGPAGADGDVARLLALLREEPVTIEQLIEGAGLAPGRTAALLMTLEIEGRVRQLEGKRFVRSGSA